MKVGLYARVSTDQQDPLAQIPRLRQWAQAGNHTVVLEETETASTRLARRPGRDRVYGEALGRRIDAVAVVKLDRWGRSLIDLKTSLEALRERGCHFYAIDQGISVKDKLDASTGLFLNILGSFAEFEREIISERTKQNMAYARDVLKKHVGRPRKGTLSRPLVSGAVSPVAGGIPLSGVRAEGSSVQKVVKSPEAGQ